MAKNNLFVASLICLALVFLAAVLSFTGALQTVLQIPNGGLTIADFDSDIHRSSQIDTAASIANIGLSVSCSGSEAKCGIVDGQELGAVARFDDSTIQISYAALNGDSMISTYDPAWQSDRIDISENLNRQFYQLAVAECISLGGSRCEPERLSSEMRDAGYLPDECTCYFQDSNICGIIGDWIIDSESTISFSRPIMQWEREYKIYDCSSGEGRYLTEGGQATWYCENNITVDFSQGYLQIMGITPDDFPIPVKQDTGVSINLKLHKPGTYTPSIPYVKEFRTGCYKGDIYWFDSENDMQGLYEVCPQSQTCVAGECVVGDINCSEEGSFKCINNNLVAVDSCGNLGDVAQKCGSDERCADDSRCEKISGSEGISTGGGTGPTILGWIVVVAFIAGIGFLIFRAVVRRRRK